ncbi:MAG: alkaline phosphatase family protein [Terriglobales bacterium]
MRNLISPVLANLPTVTSFLTRMAILCALLPIGLLNAQAPAVAGAAGKHFDRVLIVVLENQNYASAMDDPFLRELASKGANFTNFKNLTHPSYPNYLAMISGSTFNTDGSDSQQDFPDDAEHRTIGDMLNWRNYAEGYPGNDTQPFLRGSGGKYARKHVPFLSFEKVQKSTFKNVVSVDTSTGNPFVSDIAKFRQDPEKNSLPQYIYYSPNMDDDGHDPYFNAKKGLRKASIWLRSFLKDWLAFDEKTWLPIDKKMDRLLVVITFDESEGKSSNNIYTVFLGNMVKNQEIKTEYDHYSVLRTIEDNFGLEPLHKDSGDGKARVITEVWK